MIIACPVCSTGFNLPKERITSKGAKLRCSKCGHVFRIRRNDDGVPEVFYRQGEEPVPGFGLSVLPSTQDNPKTVELSHTMINPPPQLDKGFPVLPPPAEISSLESLEPKLNLFDEGTSSAGSTSDPFAGAFDDVFGDNNIEFDPFTEFSQANDEASAIEQEIPMLMAGQPRTKLEDFAEHATPGVDPKETSGLISNDGLWNNSESVFGGGNTKNVDPNFDAAPSFGMGPMFDPEPQNEPAASATPPSPALFKPPSHAPAPSQPAAEAPGQVRQPQAPTPATTQKSASGSGGKIMTIVLMIFVVATGFLGVIAFKADGVIDFKRFGHMIEVAFGDAAFAPRDEWKATPVAVVEAPSEPKKPEPLAALPPEVFHIQDVVAHPIKLSRREGVWLVQGNVLNRSKTRVLGAMADVVLKGKDGEELGTAQAPVQGPPDIKALASDKSVKRAMKRVPTELAPLEAQAKVPFWIIVPWKGRQAPTLSSYEVNVTQATQ